MRAEKAVNSNRAGVVMLPGAILRVAASAIFKVGSHLTMVHSVGYPKELVMEVGYTRVSSVWVILNDSGHSYF